MNLNIFINVPKLCVPTITKLIFLYLEINNVIDSGVKDQVLNPTDIEKMMFWMIVSQTLVMS